LSIFRFKSILWSGHTERPQMNAGAWTNGLPGGSSSYGGKLGHGEALWIAFEEIFTDCWDMASWLLLPSDTPVETFQMQPSASNIGDGQGRLLALEEQLPETGGGTDVDDEFVPVPRLLTSVPVARSEVKLSQLFMPGFFPGSALLRLTAVELSIYVGSALLTGTSLGVSRIGSRVGILDALMPATRWLTSMMGV